MSLSLILVLPIVYYFMEDLKLPKKEKPEYFSLENFKVILHKRNLYIYISVFCLFFVFTGITNFLPFRIKSINKEASEMLIGFIYSGYITGIFMSFIATKIIRLIGDETKTMLLGFSIFGFFFS